MTSIADVLKIKISELEDEKAELEDSLVRVDSKIQAYQELLDEEVETEESPVPPPKPKRKRGRPKGSGKKKIKDTEVEDKYEEAVRTLPKGVKPSTDKEKEAAIQRFSPAARPQPTYPGVDISQNRRATQAIEED